LKWSFLPEEDLEILDPEPISYSSGRNSTKRVF